MTARTDQGSLTFTDLEVGDELTPMVIDVTATRIVAECVDR